ncbi:MAG: Nre family DNA repair protein [Candidatus Aenigmatarchaeota archaeon]
MQNLWLSKLIEDKKILVELSSIEIRTVAKDVRCILCRGAKLLCGKARCPVMVRFYSQAKVKPLLENLSLEGSSPPDLFVGRIGYPWVSIGPLIPPIKGNTFLLGTPELWHGKTIEEIVDFRSQLVRGKHRVHVKDLEKNKIVEFTRELALSKTPAEANAEFLKKPSGALVLDDEVQPYGPSAPLKNLELTSIKTDHKIEKAFSDTDWKAAEAVVWLYSKGVLISKIQRAFSAGLFGLKKNRKFVPTRWSITAVDSIISQKLLEQVKEFPLINEFRVYEHFALDNRWIILMVPSFWQYELIEAWYPKTTWNPEGKEVAIYSSSEGFEGRSTYAEIGGCYYAARLAVSENLEKEKRQAGVIIFREAHPGYILPVGVWNVRENVREALKNKPLKFNSLEEALKYISSKLDIKISDWINNSNLLKDMLYQRKLLDFLTKKNL